VGAALALLGAGGALYAALGDHGAGVTTLQVGRAAASVSASPQRVVVAGGHTGTVTRLTGGGAGKDRRVVVVGGDADRAQEAGGRLYVAGGRTLTVLDDRAPTRDRRIHLPGDVSGLATGGDVAWLTLRDRPMLLRVGRAAAPIPLPHPAAAVQAAGDAVWVADPAGHALLRLDDATGRPLHRPVRTRGRPVAFAAAGDTLWVVDAQRHALLRLDARSGRSAGPPVPVAGNPVAVAADAREAWVVSAGRNVATRIDARTGRPIDEVGVSRAPMSIALTPRAAWVVSARGAVTRIPR
jgi:hypothetical protein